MANSFDPLGTAETVQPDRRRHIKIVSTLGRTRCKACDLRSARRPRSPKVRRETVHPTTNPSHDAPDVADDPPRRRRARPADAVRAWLPPAAYRRSVLTFGARMTADGLASAS